MKTNDANQKIFSGIFWIVTESVELPEHKLLLFGIPCDENGNITAMPEIRPNSKSGNTYNHKFTWETEIMGKQIHKPYNRRFYNYYPRGRVEISGSQANIFLNPHINKPHIIDEIKYQFGLDNLKISEIRIAEDGSKHYKCFFDWQND